MGSTSCVREEALPALVIARDAQQPLAEDAKATEPEKAERQLYVRKADWIAIVIP